MEHYKDNYSKTPRALCGDFYKGDNAEYKKVDCDNCQELAYALGLAPIEDYPEDQRG